MIPKVCDYFIPFHDTSCMQLQEQMEVDARISMTIESIEEKLKDEENTQLHERKR